ADSDHEAAALDNQNDRPEVIQAAATKQLGVSQRTGANQDGKLYYVALPVVRDGQIIGYVRAALPLEPLERRQRSHQLLLWGLALTVGVLAAMLTYRVVRRIVHPLDELTRG